MKRSSGAAPRMDIFLAAFDEVPDPRADNARHDLCELLVVAFVAYSGVMRPPIPILSGH